MLKKIGDLLKFSKRKMNYSKFWEELYKLDNSTLRRDFIDYFLALFKLLEENKSRSVTFELAIKLLALAYTSETYKLESDWLKIKDRPKVEAFSESIEQDNGYKFLLEVIKFQIAELHRMKEKPPTEDECMYGYTSSTGHRWSNFEQVFNFRCGIRCMGDNSQNTNEISWKYIALAFEYGRTYD